ncbi:MAG: ABC transporter ATP-binding protein, partial [Tepidisphaeraceae bacterium]
MSDLSLEIFDLGKRYRLGDKEHYRMLRDALVKTATAPVRLARRLINGAPPHDPSRELWALRNVSFDVKRGECVGIIGRNGAGKSTLLKILSRITDPTEGGADIRGRVGSLLEVGTGFHQEMSGRENIYMNGALLGMRKIEIDRKLDEIIAFAEVEKFIDTPVKRYSSGMYMRLAFAVAAHLEPEVLVVDEVLAVGDAAFQKKCLGKMGDVARHGRTILFVSHNMAAVQALCQRAVMLDRGRVQECGPVGDVVQKYIQQVTAIEAIPLVDRPDRQGDGAARVLSLRIENAAGGEVIRTGCRLRITIE